MSNEEKKSCTYRYQATIAAINEYNKQTSRQQTGRLTVELQCVVMVGVRGEDEAQLLLAEVELRARDELGCLSQSPQQLLLCVLPCPCPCPCPLWG